ncbi:Mannan endo-1,4-beta-mannosidase 2 [Hibiscus syriacus]|uniref:mannan endo-1,4-beta-mannosidase n=1 Tax=Hibiscus syriacus TaxID=106335 RepID=A0A6A3AH58_HIBSY|nr:Mannan endo-1,4-beta-mannosidase 2 [Hibiscus syriacus]
MAGNGMLYPILGFASCMAFIYMSFGDLKLSRFPRERGLSFVERNGTHFFLDGKPLYVNGWNSYWLMSHSVEENTRPKVSAMLQAGARMGLTVCRTWAFNDGGYNALQISPGQFDERVFKALDYVIAETRQHGVRLLLSFVNNLQPYGGKTQYVDWVWKEGIGLSSSNDSFFYDPSIRKYFKNYVLNFDASYRRNIRVKVGTKPLRLRIAEALNTNVATRSHKVGLSCGSTNTKVATPGHRDRQQEQRLKNLER